MFDFGFTQMVIETCRAVYDVNPVECEASISVVVAAITVVRYSKSWAEF